MSDHLPGRCAIQTLNAALALGTLAYLLGMAGLGLRKQRPILPIPWEQPIGLAGFAMLVLGNGLGLFVAPSEKFMGETGRILYVHVPAAWFAMVCFVVATVCAAAYLFKSARHWDSAMEAAIEVGIFESVLLLLLGSIFAKPTWGVWWDWDPRLTSSTVMMLSFVGVMLLRGIVREPDRRATYSAVATILSGVNVPVVYKSVEWWRSLHQKVSETTGGSTIDPSMRWILYFNAIAFGLVTTWFIVRRYRLAELRAEAEMPEPLPALAPGVSP